MSIQAELRSTPAQELTVVPRHGPLAVELDKGAGDIPWHWTELPAGLGLATRLTPAKALIGRVEAFLANYGASVERLSIRRRGAQLVVFLKLDGIEKRPITELWAALERLLSF